MNPARMGPAAQPLPLRDPTMQDMQAEGPVSPHAPDERGWTKETLIRIEMYRRQHADNDAIRRRASFSWLSWLLDETPEDLYPDPRFRRSAGQEALRQWIRAHLSWSYLGQFQTTLALKLAASLPVCALLIQQIPELRGPAPVRVLGWCFLAGLVWISAVITYQLRAPRVFRAAVPSYAGLSGTSRRQLLTSFIEQEFDQLIAIREWPSDDDRIHRRHPNQTMANIMRQNGFTPIVQGYGPEAQTRIERSLVEWANRQEIALFTFEAGQLEPLKMHRRAYEGTRPSVRHFSVRLPGREELSESSTLSPTDILIEWWDAPLQSLDHMQRYDQVLQRQLMREGLQRLMDHEKPAELMGLIVAQWTNWRNAGSRILILSLYALSLILAFTSLAIQTNSIIRAMLR